MSDLLLRVVLWTLGLLIERGSRFMPSLRSQITRTLTFELSGGEVARHWVFDATTRRASTRAGHAASADCGLHFATSRQALGVLLSTRTVDKLVDGRERGTARIDGSSFVVLWFYGLTRKFLRLGRERRPRTRIPGAYLAHDPAANGVEKIVIEPPVIRLDPAWRGAWRARATLLMVRGTTDEPAGEP
ncbi:hypothetical protein [Streptomyces chartreusis]|uniref:hypothetical protein n=1 Tax=Streptomyces chartreusis TaxID=1969 RepID=UPI0036456F18